MSDYDSWTPAPKKKWHEIENGTYWQTPEQDPFSKLISWVIGMTLGLALRIIIAFVWGLPKRIFKITFKK